jgi:glycosyltransferase involved in cell wall biosynthesis
MNNNTICVITSTHNPFDTRIFHKECYSLVNAGFSVTLMAPTDKGEKTVNGILIRGFGKLSSRWMRIVNLVKIAAMAVSIDARIYHVHEPELLLLLPILKLFKRRARFIYDVHENYSDAILSDEKHWVPNFLKPVLAGVSNAIEKVLSRSADLVVAASPDIEERFTHHKTMSVRNFAPLHVFNAVLADKREKQGTNTDIAFVYTGSLTRTRGILEIVKALELIPENHPVTFMVTGWFHDQALRREVELLPAFKRVQFLGRLTRYEEMVAAISGARAALVCFHHDPNLDNAVERSNKLFEYMGLGIPLIISKIPGWAAMVDKYDCGKTVDPLDPKDIAEKMIWLATHPDEAARMGENGKRAVAEHYSWEQEGARLVAAYHQLLGDTV